jgi:integrase
LSGEPKLIAQLLYGSGLCLNEAVRLRIKDLDGDAISAPSSNCWGIKM